MTTDYSAVLYIALVGLLCWLLKPTAMPWG